MLDLVGNPEGRFSRDAAHNRGKLDQCLSSNRASAMYQRLKTIISKLLLFEIIGCLYFRAKSKDTFKTHIRLASFYGN